jgi:hypothetical protein
MEGGSDVGVLHHLLGKATAVPTATAMIGTSA